MQNKTWKRIESNPNLVAFCNRILNYNSIFEHEMTRSMFLVSLISADSLLNEHDCDETIEVANFILNHMDLFILEDNIKKDIISKMKSAIKIAKRDKKEFFIKKVEKIVNNGK